MRGDYVAKLEGAIREVVEGWPPLTPDQIARLAGLFRPGEVK
jgi:hypothetical protein